MQVSRNRTKGIFDFALINTNSRRNETLMIGDCFEADIFGARQSRIDQLWFNPQGLPPQEFTPNLYGQQTGRDKNTFVNRIPKGEEEQII